MNIVVVSRDQQTLAVMKDFFTERGCVTTAHCVLSFAAKNLVNSFVRIAAQGNVEELGNLDGVVVSIEGGILEKNGKYTYVYSAAVRINHTTSLQLGSRPILLDTEIVRETLKENRKLIPSDAEEALLAMLEEIFVAIQHYN